MSKLPREIRKQLKTFVSKTTDEALDLVVNLTGKYIDQKKREKLKKEAELDVGTKIEKAITKSYQIGLELREEYEQKKLETKSLKEKFYLVTDAVFKSVEPDIPKNVHAMDYFFQVLEELSRDFRFNLPYLHDTKYVECLKGLEELMDDLREENKIGKTWEVLNEFKDSKNSYLIVQVTLQKLIEYYEFLARVFSEIKKRHIDKYLEIYEELSGLYEKLISLISTLIQLLRRDDGFKYEAARKRGLQNNISYIKKTAWKIFVSDFNRNMRNAIVHKMCNVDIIKETVEFIDRKKTITLTFREVQKKTRELSALLLILPHVLISIFCMAVLSVKEMLDSLP